MPSSDADKKYLKDLLSQCTDKEQERFKLMYGRDGGRRSMVDTVAMDINVCVDVMDDDRVERAIEQCERTIQKRSGTNI